MREALPLLRDLPPLAAVVRCDVCRRLVMIHDLCINQPEADWCMSPDRLTEYLPVEAVS